MYVPGQFDGQNVGLYLQEELQRISEAFTPLDDGQIALRYAAPEKPRSGMYFADGTDWNPGNGKGAYRYDETLQTYVFMEHPAGVQVETDPTVPAHVKAITALQVGNWDTAYGWGDHALVGYLTSFTETDPTVPAHVKGILTGDITNWNAAFGWGNHASAGYAPLASPAFTGNPTAPTPLSADNDTSIATTAFVKAQGYLTSFTETDPTVAAHIKSITTTEKANWNTAFGWGNHASQGYLTDTVALDSPDKAQELSALIDLNTLSANQSGFYYQTSNADTTGNNYPNGHAGSLIVQRSAGNATQMYITYPEAGNHMFFRSYYNTAWGSWNQVWHSGVFANNSANWNTAYGWGNHAGLYLPIAGQAADSALLGGAAASVTAGNNTIVKRHSSGYIYCNYLNTTAGFTTGNPTGYWVETGSDGFHRKMTAANVAADLDSEAWTFSGNARHTSNCPMYFGIDGGYGEGPATTGFGATIWGIGASYVGGTSGTNSAITSLYGLKWLRSGHTNYNSAAVGEGLYVYQNGVFKGGMGTAGLYTVGGLRVDLNIDLNGNIIGDGASTISGIETITVDSTGDITKASHGNYLYHQSTVYDDDQEGGVTFSTGAPTGGADGDIWFRYT